MKTKKLIPTLFATAVLALTGCTSSNGGQEGGSGGEKKGHFDHEVTIKFSQAYAQGYQAQLQSYVDKFNEIEPYVKIKLEDGWISGNYDTIHNQTISDIGTGEYGDLVVCYSDHVVDYIDYGKAVKLDDYMNNPEYGWTEAEKADMIQGFLIEGQSFPIEGTYCLPFSKSTEAMFYNKTILLDTALVSFLATKNITMNEQYLSTLTWEELFGKLCPALDEYAANGHKLIETQENGINAYVGYDSDANLFITLAQQYGYGYTSMDSLGVASLDFNNDNMKGLMKTFADASKKNYFRTPATIGASYSSDYFKKMNTLFSIGSTAGVKNQVASDFDVGVTRIPQAANHDPKLISQGPSMCILSHGDKDRVLASWLFYKFITSTNNTAKWATTVGYLPVRTSAYTSETYQEYCDDTGKDARSLELLSALNAKYSSSTSSYVFTTPAFKGSSSARTQVGSLVATMFKDVAAGKTIDDAYLKTAFDLAVNNIKKDM